MDNEKRRVVAPPKWMHVPEGHVAEVGNRTIVGTGPGSKKQLARVDVFLDGERIGALRQVERRGERRTKGSRLVTVTGWPVEWRREDRPGHFVRYGSTALNESVWTMVRDHLSERAARED